MRLNICTYVYYNDLEKNVELIFRKIFSSWYLIIHRYEFNLTASFNTLLKYSSLFDDFLSKSLKINQILAVFIY